MTDPEHRHNRSQAGAYGFSRIDVAALLLVLVIAAGFGLYEWWQRQATAVAAPWVVEDAVVAVGATADSEGVRGSGPDVKPGPLIDVNTAPAAELARLPGIGPVLAGRIIDERERSGTFRDLSDLQRVPGIGAAKTRALVGWVMFSQAGLSDTVLDR